MGRQSGLGRQSLADDSIARSNTRHPGPAGTLSARSNGSSARRVWRQTLRNGMKEYPMAQDKEERPNVTVKRTSEAGDEAMKRTAGAQNRSVPRESANDGDGGLTAHPGQ